MDATEILSYLKTFDTLVLIVGFIAFLLTFLIKKMIPDRFHRIVFIVPFILGIIAFGIYYCFFLGKTEIFEPLKKGIQAGGVATFYYAVFKQVYKSGNVKGAVKEILTGIFSNKTVKNVSKEISASCDKTASVEENKRKISEIIAENASVSEKQCEVLTDIILSAMKNGK